MLSSSPSKITNHSSPACPRDPRTSDSARKLRNTRVRLSSAAYADCRGQQLGQRKLPVMLRLTS